MTKIAVMSDSLANKIAAGEVIERISSVVKELVENSLDAESSEIKINLTDSGFKKIEIIDNGVGMDKEDAMLCFERHATSKLKKDDDLFFISSLGFRGEALPSIASVSKISLVTSTGDGGTKILLEAGKIKNVENTDFKRGTQIIVTELFYNTPARLKFLKNESSELSNVVSLIEKLSFSYPGVSFILTNNDRTIIKTSGSSNLHKTIFEIYGLGVSKNVMEIHRNNDDFEVSGYIVRPEYLKSNRNYMITFINNRLVRNFDINKAINEAYYTYKPKDKFPIVVINIEVDPTLIDVNIHPSKQEVKVSKIADLCDLIYNEIKVKLNKTNMIPLIEEDEPRVLVDSLHKESVQTTFNFNEVVTKVKEVDKVNKEVEISSFKLYPVGLVHGTYIVAQNEEGMYLIDQHAAAERIRYENNMKALKERSFSIKSLLIPINIELSKSEFVKFNEKSDDFKNLGFEFENFGEHSILVKAHPNYLTHGYEKSSIEKIINLVINSTYDRVKFEESVAIMLACKMSIKANHKISIMEMEYFLNTLVKCENPFNCPHGRPTIIKYTIYELEKLFKRVM